MSIRSAKITADEDWQALRSTLDPRGHVEAVGKILADARSHGAVSVLIEEDYLDRDFTSEFSAFYSTVFKRYSKLCRRFHFFSVNVEPIIVNPDAQKVAEGLSKISEDGHYIGYIVTRPVAHAPLGRVVFRAPVSPTGMQSDLLVRSEFHAHVLGGVLKVRGVAFTQQDSRIGACAQASIWMAARHFYSKHHGTQWFSTVDITEAGSKLTDQILSRSLPAGSGGLSIDNMLRALRGLGQETFLYFGKYEVKQKKPSKVNWSPTLPPKAIIERYIDSGIPVILVLCPWDAKQEQFHAILATGHTVRLLDKKTILPVNPTRAEFARYFLVNDDQRGSNLRMACEPDDPLAETPYNLSHVTHIVLPLPGKVFTPAETAEKRAWGTLRYYEGEWPKLRETHAKEIENSIAAGDNFVKKIASNEVIARTYLTYGWRYKERLIRNSCSDTIKSVVLPLDLPRFVWVTEFGTRESFNHLDENAISIFGHAVIDATSSPHWEGRILFHAPGFLWKWVYDPVSKSDNIREALICIPNEHPYKMKIRGS